MTDSEEVRDLQARLARLDERVRTQQRWLIGGAGLFVAACAAAASSNRDTQREVRAERFVVVDSMGEALGTFASDVDLGDVGITLRAKNGSSSAFWSIVSQPQQVGAPTESAVLLQFKTETSDGRRGQLALGTSPQYAQVEASSNGFDVGFFAEEDQARVRAGAQGDRRQGYATLVEMAATPEAPRLEGRDATGHDVFGKR